MDKQRWLGSAAEAVHASSCGESAGDATHPHDLLWIRDANALSADLPLPTWATPDWLLSAPVVVRRERTDDEQRIPVGLRGTARNQRCKAYLDSGAVARCVRPEMLAASAAWRRQRLGQFPALEALEALALPLDATGLAWGPTGSVGFALASGLPVLRPDSDLDLLVRAPRPLKQEQIRALLLFVAAPICRIDLQLDTGHGGFALAEWADGPRPVLLKT
ncbi:MAG TPA: malonate decarboxylase holo-ACP synthase, partial [Burkholderiaceae bacterium]|nr:malonate decarboxylase holo-ACP synthase [Burkholderiaceae bacterium]